MPIYSPKSSGGPEDIVRYGKQFLTAEQKAQALDNIGAGSGGVPSSGPAIGWRIRFIDQYSGSGGIVSASQLQVRATVGGIDQCIGGTAISSTILGMNDLYTPFRLFDNDVGTLWACATNEPFPWAGYLFASPVNCGQILLATSTSAVQSPRSFQIQKTYDGVRWITERTVIDEPTWGSNEARPYAVP